ncbi:MAG: AAA domain-containing protein, partial [Flavisolibacter sp.]
MEYFRKLHDLLKLEKEADRKAFEMLTSTLSIQDRRENGMTWYPIAIKGTETGRGDYLTVEIERTTHADILHQLRFGMTAALFSNHDAKQDRIEGTITHISGNRLKLSLRTDELPDWSRRGKLGVDAVFDENSYAEMEAALRLAPQLSEKKEEGLLIRILTGQQDPSFDERIESNISSRLNEQQQEAVRLILSAGDLAIVHGPPGTGKTTTLVEAIRILLQTEKQKLLVVAPSNAAVDLLSEKLFDKGLNVVRIGNPARVQEKQ